MRFTKICCPVYDSEEEETNGENHKRELIHCPVLGATEHDASVDHRGKALQVVTRPTRHRFENR